MDKNSVNPSFLFFLNLKEMQLLPSTSPPVYTQQPIRPGTNGWWDRKGSIIQQPLFSLRESGFRSALRSFPDNGLMDLLTTNELGEDSPPLTNINKNGSCNRTDCIMHVKPERRRAAWKTQDKCTCPRLWHKSAPICLLSAPWLHRHSVIN